MDFITPIIVTIFVARTLLWLFEELKSSSTGWLLIVFALIFFVIPWVNTTK
jgi:hypothetical protein